MSLVYYFLKNVAAFFMLLFSLSHCKTELFSLSKIYFHL